MTLTSRSRVAIAGAGSIGCYLGGRLALAGRDVTLLLREDLGNQIAAHGLRVSALDHDDRTLAPEKIRLATDPACLAGAEVVLVTVKCRDTAAMSDLIARHADPGAVVVSLQNGVDNAPVLRHRLGPRVVAGMVPFNVVQTRSSTASVRFHRATSGTIQIGDDVASLAELLDVPGAEVQETSDIDAVLWSKLLINLNNALNALSDLPLLQELGDRRWRRLLARQMREAFPVLRAAGIRLARLEGVHPRLVAMALPLPDVLFRLAARKILAVDPAARSSMWEDLRTGRPTEIDCIQGSVLKHAEAAGLAVPLTAAVARLIREAEAAGKGPPGLTPGEIARAG